MDPQGKDRKKRKCTQTHEIDINLRCEKGLSLVVQSKWSRLTWLGRTNETIVPNGDAACDSITYREQT